MRHTETAMPKNTYTVTIPIAGHAYIEVDAESEEAAIEAALGKVTIDHIETWEPLEQFNQGNICYCPHPWEAEARDLGPVEDETDTLTSASGTTT